jgi:hypothetical protein
MLIGPIKNQMRSARSKAINMKMAKLPPAMQKITPAAVKPAQRKPNAM